MKLKLLYGMTPGITGQSISSIGTAPDIFPGFRDRLEFIVIMRL